METKNKKNEQNYLLSLSDYPTLTAHPFVNTELTTAIASLDFRDICTEISLTKNRTLPEIEKVIFRKPYTIVVWANGDKTVVNCSEEDFDEEKGLAIAIARKYMSRGEFKRMIKNADIQEQ